MGLSLRNLGKKIWETVTPQNEEAIRRSEASNQAALNTLRNAPSISGPLADPVRRQAFIKQQSQPQNFSIPQAFGQSAKKVGTGIGLAGLRVGTGVGQGFSGLYDLATPGRGTNRFSKGLASFGRDLDMTARAEDVEPLYQAAQVPIEVGTFLAPSATFKLLDTAGKGNRFARAATSTRPLINKPVANLVTKPSTLLNAGVGTVRSQGFMSGTGQDVSPQSFATAGALSLGLGGTLNVVAPGIAKLANKLNKPKITAKTPSIAQQSAATPVQKPVVTSKNTIPPELGYFADETEISQINRILKNEDTVGTGQKIADYYRTAKGEDWKVVQMTPDEYLRRSGKAMGVDDAEKWASTPMGDPKKYAADMKKGDKFPMPWINEVTGAQEGRTRALAAKAAGQETIPVAVAEKYNPRATQPTKPKVTVKQRDKMRLDQKLSTDRLIRENVTRPVGGAINRAIYRGSVSQNPLVRGPARLVQGLGRGVGLDDADKLARGKMYGSAEAGRVKGIDFADSGSNVVKESRERIWATLDPEQARKAGMKPAVLSPEEVAEQGRIKAFVDETTQGNLQRGLIDEGEASNPNYLMRDYTFLHDVTDKKVEAATKDALLKQYGPRANVSRETAEKAIKDPYFLAATKRAKSEAAWAIVDHANYLFDSGKVFNKGGKGLTQLPDTPLYGKARGKWVANNLAQDFVTVKQTSALLNSIGEFLNLYDRWLPRRAKKQLLTVFNPAVRVGNQMGNRVFALANGLNPVEFEFNYRRASKLIKSRDPLYLEAVQRGLTGSDITQVDFVKQLSEYVDDPNILKDAGNWFQRTYSNADDKARLAAFVTHVKQGYSLDEAARLTQRGFQDYRSVGFFFNRAAQIPLIGNAFVRFANDALRIGKNALVDHPIRTVGLVSMYGAFNEVMSRLSGEEESDQATREGRFGTPSIPGTRFINKTLFGNDRNISLTTQVPGMGELNVARMFPWVQLNDIDKGANRFLPIQRSPIGRDEQGNWGLRGSGFNDPLLGQVAQLAIDEDFKGESIQDPENKGQFVDELPKDQKIKNVARFLATNNLPLGREGDALISAFKGQPDIYGKKRSPGQAALRAVGVKTEQFGPEEVKDTNERNAFFDEKAEIDKEVRQLPKGIQEAYKRVTGYYKLREKTENEFKPGTERYVKAPVYKFPEDKWKDYTANSELYDMIKTKKERDNKRQGTPIQPEFDDRLSPEFRKQLISNKSIAPGDDVEADQRLYNHPEWDKYQTIRDEYSKKAKEYYPKSDEDFVDELVKHKTAKFPEKGPAKKAYDEAFALYAKGQGPKPTYTSKVNAEKEAYNTAKWEWTNKERRARGLPPISKETWDNVTFGFEPDEEKVFKELYYGKGFGGFGNRKKTAGSVYKYAVSLNAGGTSVKPKVSVKQTASKRPAKRKYPKPKVTLKKSRV